MASRAVDGDAIPGGKLPSENAPACIGMGHTASFEALNATLEERSRARQNERAGRHEQTIDERLAADKAALRDLPATPFEPCHKCSTKVSSMALVRYRLNDYSVPATYGFAICW